MNSTSLGSRFVRMAARSPARSSTGPDVCRRLTPISRAMMCASVVLPSPGGPKSSTWSSASLRLRAASMKISSCPRIFSWPMYSSSAFGRSARSNASSCGEVGAAATSRSVSIMVNRHSGQGRIQCTFFWPSRLRQHLQRVPYAFGDAEAAFEVAHCELRFLLVVSKREERVHDVASCPIAFGAHCDHRNVELVFQLEQQALGGLLADAGYPGEAPRLLPAHRVAQIRDAHSGEHCERGACTDAGNLQERPEERTHALGEEREKLMRVTSHA